MFGHGNGGSNNGVQICVEPLCEWKIQEIAYDGFEKYLKPQDFNGLLRKNAQRVNWRKIIGNETSFDWSAQQEDGGGDEVDATVQQALSPAEQATSSASTNFYEPAVGPWASVGKHLHHALQEIHILLDALRISSRTYYLGPVVNALVQDERTEAELVALAKAYQLCTRKKTLVEAARVIERLMKQRQQQQQMATEEEGEGGEEDGANFTKELRELRENWRIRKVGATIHGDLGYKTYVPKFAAHDVFDVVQKTVNARRVATLRHSNPSYIDVRVAHNLRHRTRLLVFVEPDNALTAHSVFSANGGPAGEGEGEEEEEGGGKHVHWKRALAWAQRTLIHRDLLAQLLTESVSQQHGLVTLSTDQSITIALFDNLLLRVELRSYPFQDQHFPPDEGIPYLSQSLRELFLAEHTTKPKRNQQFVTLPPTSLPDSLDFRGPQALSAEEIAARMQATDPLIKKFVECASHYVLVTRVVDFLEHFLTKFTDPQPQWKWIRATPNFTLIFLNFSNRGFENLGKFSSYIRITESSVTLISKEMQQVNCRRDMEILGEALLLLTANFLVNTLNMLSKAYAWQIFHANINAFDVDGNPAPTFYACNQSATKNIFIQFHTDGRPPAIYIKDGFSQGRKGGTTNTSQMGGPMDLGGFYKLDYARIPGSTFMRKIDNLLATFIN